MPAEPRRPSDAPQFMPGFEYDLEKGQMVDFLYTTDAFRQHVLSVARELPKFPSANGGIWDVCDGSHERRNDEGLYFTTMSLPYGTTESVREVWTINATHAGPLEEGDACDCFVDRLVSAQIDMCLKNTNKDGMSESKWDLDMQYTVATSGRIDVNLKYAVSTERPGIIRTTFIVNVILVRTLRTCPFLRVCCY